MTAVDILWDMIPKDTQNYIIKQFNGLEKAKEMEKEQIEQAFEIGADSYYDLRQPSSCIQYYNETYGGNK
jgi:hypothetical protein